MANWSTTPTVRSRYSCGSLSAPCPGGCVHTSRDLSYFISIWYTQTIGIQRNISVPARQLGRSLMHPPGQCRCAAIIDHVGQPRGGARLPITSMMPVMKLVARVARQHGRSHPARTPPPVRVGSSTSACHVRGSRPWSWRQMGKSGPVAAIEAPSSPTHRQISVRAPTVNDARGAIAWVASVRFEHFGDGNMKPRTV